MSVLLLTSASACSKPNSTTPQTETKSDITSVKLETKSIEQAANEAAGLIETEADQEAMESQSKAPAAQN